MAVNGRLFSRLLLHRVVGKRYLETKPVINEQEKDVLKIEMRSGDEKGVLVLGFNRPNAKNALNRNLTYSLEDALETAKYEKSVRVVILSSSVPEVFCAGADLKERLTLSQSEVASFVSRLRNLMNTIENLPVPVIAAIDGVALGGGLEIALASDIRIASEASRMGLVETSLAIIPGAGGTQRLPRIIGPSMAKELIFTSRVLKGAEAYNLGLVNQCVPSNKDKNAALLRSLSVAKEMLANGPTSLKMAKVAINKGSQVDLATGLSIEELCYQQVIPTKDRLEGLRAFKEKRKPIYTGE